MHLKDGTVGSCKKWVPAGGHWLAKLAEESEEELFDDTWRKVVLQPGANVSFRNGRKGTLEEWIPPTGHWIVEVGGERQNIEPKLLVASTGAWQCALVEILALVDQPPHWFVSHW